MTLYVLPDIGVWSLQQMIISVLGQCYIHIIPGTLNFISNIINVVLSNTLDYENSCIFKDTLIWVSWDNEWVTPTWHYTCNLKINELFWSSFGYYDINKIMGLYQSFTDFFLARKCCELVIDWYIKYMAYTAKIKLLK